MCGELVCWVCLALLCSLKAQGERDETEEWERGMEKAKRGREIKREIALMCLWYVCLCCRGDLFSSPPISSCSFLFFHSLSEYFFFPSCICRLSRQRALFHSRLMSQLKLMCSVCSDKEERGGKSLSRNNGSVLHIGNQSFLVWAHANASQHWQL